MFMVLRYSFCLSSFSSFGCVSLYVFAITAAEILTLKVSIVAFAYCLLKLAYKC